MRPRRAPTGAWHAFTGSSGGWTDWTVDLSQYAGKKIDIRLSAVTDWGTLGLGTWIDDLRLSDGNTTLESNDFETNTGTGWTIGPPPAGTDNPTNGWNRRTKMPRRAASSPPTTRSSPGSLSRASTRRRATSS